MQPGTHLCEENAGLGKQGPHNTGSSSTLVTCAAAARRTVEERRTGERQSTGRGAWERGMGGRRSRRPLAGGAPPLVK